ncbi:MAG: V-type ATP synthase subunit I [Candidatus Nanohaloarchaea archaeon]
MTKISVTGSKRDMEQVIEELYRLQVLDLDDYEGEFDLEKGSPLEEAEDLSEFLIDVRSLISKLPDVEETRERTMNISDVQDKLPELTEEIESINNEKAQIESKINSVKEQRKFFRKLQGTGLRAEDLEGTGTLESFIGEFDQERFEELIPNDRYDIFKGEGAKVVFYPSDYSEEFRYAIDESRTEELTLVDTDMEGAVESINHRLKTRRSELESEVEDLERDLESISEKWRGTLEDTEEFLTERVEKAEAPLSFATTYNAFIGQGWIPSQKFQEVEEKLADVTDGRIHVQREEGENPPVKHENNRFVQPFESLTDLRAVPKYNEIDPSLIIFLTYPLFFGFMIGDAGYGLTTLAIFYLGYRLFDANDLFKSLMYGSIATIIFGLAFGDAFGFVLFGEHSVLAQQFGLSAFSQVPILFHRAENLDMVFQISALIGLAHVNLGYLLGAYNEYRNHGYRQALLEKGSWIALEMGAALWYFEGMTAGLPVILLSIITLYMGEGIAGVVEIPSLLSNVLSYLRIFGVSVAAVALAAVVNSLAQPFFQMGSVVGIALGVMVLIFGHTFNSFIKIIEGFLQGIRLHYVEMFTKFFEGGGRRYAPFGAEGSA